MAKTPEQNIDQEARDGFLAAEILPFLRETDDTEAEGSDVETFCALVQDLLNSKSADYEALVSQFEALRNKYGSEAPTEDVEHFKSVQRQFLRVVDVLIRSDDSTKNQLARKLVSKMSS